MRKVRDGEEKNEKKNEKKEKKKKKKNNDKNSGPLTSLPVNPLNGDRLQRRRSCQFCLHLNSSAPACSFVCSYVTFF